MPGEPSPGTGVTSLDAGINPRRARALKWEWARRSIHEAVQTIRTISIRTRCVLSAGPAGFVFFVKCTASHVITGDDGNIEALLR
jgi:hypothetical protein